METGNGNQRGHTHNNSQQCTLTVEELMQDFEDFENMFLVPYTDGLICDNEFIDMNKLDEILNNEVIIQKVSAEEVHSVKRDEGLAAQSLTPSDKGNGQDNDTGSSDRLENLPDCGSFMDDIEFIDINYLYEILDSDIMNENAETENVHLVVEDECYSAGQCTNEVVVDSQMTIDNAALNAGENEKKWVTRKRYRKGTAEAARKKEENKIKNREAAFKSFAKKQAYIYELELQVQKLQKENEYERKFLQFLATSTSKDRSGRQLQRTASGPI